MASFLQVENISKSYGDRVLFKNISFNINEGDKIALIAPNGTGKSTLLSILAGKDSSDMGGEIKFMKNIKVHFLEQNDDFNPDSTIFDTLFHGSEDISHAISQYESAIASGDPKRIEKAINLMDATDAWTIDQDIKTTMSLLELEDGSKLIRTLSGGERKRVALAAMIIDHADFLVMDEPTNHLDLKTIEFLEDYLKKSRCTLFMVTHDRYFLDRICNYIYEMDEHSIFGYAGNYSYFVEKKQERIDNMIAETEKAKNLYRTELDWMRRMPCARGTKAKYRIDAFHSLKEKIGYRHEEKKININVDTARVGKKILECHDVCFNFGDRVMLDHFNYKFARREKVGIVGENGIGKTTFLKLITGALQPLSGEIQVGETIRYGYYSQEGLKFKEDQTIIELVREIAEVVTLADGTRLSVTGFLNHFLFPPNCHNTKIYKLSGGEKRRLYLLTVLMRNPNFLILDEPTNDLDIITLNVLEDYLINFAGPMIIVSHDRYFLDKIVDHLFVFSEGGEVKDFPGSYTDYREFMKEHERELHAAAASASASEAASTATTANLQRDGSEKKKKLSYKEQKEFEALDREISELNEEKEKIEALLSGGESDTGKIAELSKRYSEVKDLLDEKEMRWLELSEI